MDRIDIQSFGQDRRVEDAQHPNEHSTAITVVRSDTQAALRLVERRARRLRSAEAQVADLRLALDQEIARAIDTTPATRSDETTLVAPERQIEQDIRHIPEASKPSGIL